MFLKIGTMAPVDDEDDSNYMDDERERRGRQKEKTLLTRIMFEITFMSQNLVQSLVSCRHSNYFFN